MSDETRKNAKVAGSNYRNLTGTEKEVEIIYSTVQNRERSKDEFRNAMRNTKNFQYGSRESGAKYAHKSHVAKKELKTYRKDIS